MKTASRTLFVLLFLFLSRIPAHTQHTVGRWTLSAHVDANAWFNDYKQRIVALGGGANIRYGVARQFSLGADIFLARFKAGQDPLRVEIPYPYLALNTFSLSLIGRWHLLPGNSDAPYLFAGVGFLSYSQSSPTGPFVRGVSRTSIYAPVGVGIEMFVRQKLSYDFSIGYAFLNDATDAVRRGVGDGSLRAQFGVNLYLGRSIDDDEDGDGLTNAEEARLGTNATNPDTDEDGLTDSEELRVYKTDPLHSDTDNDKLKDGDEVLKFQTDPLKPDTDADGINDGEEVFAGTDPLDPQSHP